jgi:GT2 family glycosyltransferase
MHPSYPPPYASLIVLSYKRTEMFAESLISLKQSLDMPAEIIVVDDCSDNFHRDLLVELLRAGAVSSVVLGDRNQGVGEAVRIGFGAASGHWLFKLDADLLYRKGWLSRACALLNHDTDVGMVGFFKYLADHPTVQFRKTNPKPYADGWLEVDDFVSSAFGIHRELWQGWHDIWTTHSAAFAEDVDFKNKLKTDGLKLVITDEDYVVNKGFGLGRSTVVEATGDVHRISARPALFGVTDGNHGVGRQD